MTTLKLSDQEKRLLRQQAEAYAFIQDLRDAAIIAGNQDIVRRTEGVELTIERRRQEYPNYFQRYFKAAYARGAKARMDNLNGKRATVQRREAPPKTKERPKLADSKPKKKPKAKPGTRRNRPE